jgi:hypothetical protein
MKVSEIKAKLPEAEVYQLRADVKYLIVADKTAVSRESAEGLLRGMPNAAIMLVKNPSESIRLLEVEE